MVQHQVQTFKIIGHPSFVITDGQDNLVKRWTGVVEGEELERSLKTASGVRLGHSDADSLWKGKFANLTLKQMSELKEQGGKEVISAAPPKPSYNQNTSSTYASGYSHLLTGFLKLLLPKIVRSSNFIKILI